MDLRATPNHKQLARQVAQQMAKEVFYFGSLNGSLVEPEIEVSPGDAVCGREHRPVEVILQHRSLSARGLGAQPVGIFQEFRV
jgi:hypothetical protein